MALTKSIYRGAISTADRGDNMHPEEWRSKIYEQLPVGKAPMTAMLMGMGSKPTSSRKIHWPGQAFCGLRGDVTDVYTSSNLSSAYSSGGVDGTTLYIKMSAADVKQVVAGDVIMIVDGDGYKRRLLVNAVHVDGDSSFLSTTLMETDTSNKLAGSSLTWRIIGHAQPEMSELPDSIYEEPQWFENYAQIFMESLTISGTELEEEDRLNPKLYARAKKNALMRLRNKMERAFIFGKKKTATGANGKPQLYMDGLYTAIQDNEPANIFNYVTDTDYSGKDWDEDNGKWGVAFLDKIAIAVSRYSDTPRRICYCGDLAWLGLKNLAIAAGTYNVDEKTDSLGMVVTKFTGLIPTFDFIQHPLLAEDPAFRRSALIIEPNMLTYRPMRNRDLQFVKAADKNTDGFSWVDGIKEGWWVQCSLEYDGLTNFAWVDNIGANNTLS